MCVHACEYRNPQKPEDVRSLELDLQAVISLLTWVQGSKLGSSAEAIHALNCRAISPAYTTTLSKNQTESLLSVFICGTGSKSRVLYIISQVLHH